MATSRREKLIETADRLFSTQGYHATGIDQILAEAGVAKMTLYSQFGSKDELILAVLRTRDQWFRNHVARELARRSDDPAERLVILFDVIDEFCNGTGEVPLQMLAASPTLTDKLNEALVEVFERKIAQATEVMKSKIEAQIFSSSPLMKQYEERPPSAGDPGR